MHFEPKKDAVEMANSGFRQLTLEAIEKIERIESVLSTNEN
jgi:hypothetical protein